MSAVRRCPFCDRLQLVRHDVDLAGREHELVDACLACPDGRRVAGVCRDCPRPVSGRLGIAVRCDRCRKREARAASRRWRERYPDRDRARQEASNRKRREDPLERHRRRERERAHRRRAEVRKRILEQRRRRHLADPEKEWACRRRYKERHPEKVREQQRAANEKRAAAKREHMHRYATKYVGPGKLPLCACGARVPFDGRGRPHKRCPACDPKAWQRDQTRTAAAA